MIIDWANKFDRTSETLIDKLMCSQVCPCHSIRSIDSNGSRIDPAWLWMQMKESELNHYGRTKETFGTGDLVPLVFRANKEGTYTNFEDCYVDLSLKKIISPVLFSEAKRKEIAASYKFELDNDFFAVLG